MQRVWMSVNPKLYILTLWILTVPLDEATITVPRCVTYWPSGNLLVIRHLSLRLAFPSTNMKILCSKFIHYGHQIYTNNSKSINPQYHWQFTIFSHFCCHLFFYVSIDCMRLFNSHCVGLSNIILLLVTGR